MSSTPTCLIAENDPFIAALLERFAEASGLQPFHVGIGQDVVEMARRTGPAVIILDLELPGKIRGWEVGTVLSTDSGLCRIPIILCAWPEAGETAASLRGAAGYLQKPDLHYDDFVAALREAGLDAVEPAAAMMTTEEMLAVKRLQHTDQEEEA